MKRIIITTLMLGSLALVSCGMGTKKQAQGKDSATKAEAATTDRGSAAIELTKAEFLKRVMDYESNSETWNYQGDKPAIIDFHATWCGPCKILSPILEEIAKEYEGQLYVYKVDVDKEKELAALFGIEAMPTVWYIPMKGDPQYVRGLQPKAEIVKAIDNLLLNKQ